MKRVKASVLTDLAKNMDSISKQLSPLTHFILPGGGSAAATCHLARAVCRRAERSVVLLSQHQPVDPDIQVFLNRLSDFLFVSCRVLCNESGHEEVFWPD